MVFRGNDETVVFRITARDETGAATRSSRRNFRQLEEEATRSSNRLQARFRSLALDPRVGVAAIGVAAGAAATTAVREFLRVGDALDKMSQRTGESVESLSTWRIALERAGSSIQSFERAQQSFARRLDDLRRPTSDAALAMQELGLTLADIENQSFGRVLTNIAAGLDGITDATERANLAQRLLGRSSADLLPLLGSGATGVNAALASARATGNVFST